MISVYTKEEVEVLLREKDLEVYKREVAVELQEKFIEEKRSLNSEIELIKANLKEIGFKKESEAKQMIIDRLTQLLDDKGLSMTFTELIALVQTAKVAPVSGAVQKDNHNQGQKPKEDNKN